MPVLVSLLWNSGNKHILDERVYIFVMKMHVQYILFRLQLYLCRYTSILIFYEVVFVILDRKDCTLVGLRQTVGVFAIITLCLQLFLIWGQVLPVILSAFKFAVYFLSQH